jgi:hypothetical protein
LSTTAEDHIATRRAPDRSSAFPFPFSGSSARHHDSEFQEKSLGLLFGLAFSLAWWSEVARRLPVLMALGAAVILAGAAFRLGWEAALFSLVFVAMWHFAADKRL